MADRQFLKQLAKKLADEGRIIEAGWVTLRLSGFPPADTPSDQMDLLRLAFMCGAAHMFNRILDMPDSETAPGEKDVAILDLMNDELNAFARDVRLHAEKTAGSA